VQSIKLHLGCGPHIFEGWKNVDLEPGSRGVKADLRKGLPWQGTETVDYIFTEHFIEHLTRDDGQRFLDECYRVLRPRGVLRISTPDLNFLVDCFELKQTDHWVPTWRPRSPSRMLNEGMRLWGHQFLYDVSEMIQALHEAGFQFVEKCDWRQSRHPDLKGMEIRPFIGDLIVEAMK
jgi:predicted SAM-dependent methyltransferase